MKKLINKTVNLMLLLFLSTTLFAQTGNQNPFVPSFAEDSLFKDSDLLLIALGGGLSRIDKNVLNGTVINDSTIFYKGENHEDTLRYKIKYLKNGKLLDDWTALADTAFISFRLSGKTKTINTEMNYKQITDTLWLYGINALSKHVTIKTNSVWFINPYRIWYKQLRFWYIVVPTIKGILGINSLTANKADGKIISGNGNLIIRTTMNGKSFDNRFSLEFLEENQLKLTDSEGREKIIDANNLKTLLP